jgi:predicted enzyme involved in methoxymalonyl-ACP biosynthesis
MLRLEEDWRIGSWETKYIPTRKNQQTADFWDRLGLDVAGNDDQAKHYQAVAGQRNCSYEGIITLESE